MENIMSIFQVGHIKRSKALGIVLLLAIIASLTVFTPTQAQESLKTVLSKHIIGKTVILTVRDVATGKIETITGKVGRDKLVVMEDPTKASLPTLPIERVKARRWVPTRNPVTGKTEYKQVKRTFVHTVPAIVILRLADAKTGKVVETLKGTPEHPFFTADNGMVGMGHLRVGEKVISRIGPALLVASVVPESKPGGYKVYNFEVADDHTYFVGKANGGTWVHNACMFDWSRAGHIFREAAGHVNPSTLASQGRFARLFEQVGSNPANLRTDAVAAGLTPPQGAAAGINAFTQVFSNGKQIWVLVRNNTIINAGVNAAGAIR